MIALDEAGDIWNIAHSITLREQGARALVVGGNSGGGIGDSKHFMDWAASVRKCAPGDELETFVLDCVYGDSHHNPDMKSRRGAVVLLRRFRDALQVKPEILADLSKMRRIFFDE